MRGRGGRQAARPVTPLSSAHGASLATTAGITSVISGVLAVGLLAQTPPSGTAEGLLAGVALVGLLAAAIALYTARNRVCLALDLAPFDPDASTLQGARALAAYHAGMAGFFAALAVGAVWRVALIHGGIGWVAAAIAFGAVIHALGQALYHRGEARRAAVLLAAPEPYTLHVPIPEPYVRNGP